MHETGYTKLFSTIITSTIWREDDKTRIVWITLLALANRYGEVSGSIPGLAAIANVSEDDCRKAISKLESPDPDSRSKESEGRRISTVEGGWQIINYQKYRNKMRSAERIEYMRAKQQEHRQRLSTMSTNVNPSQPIAEAEAEAKAFKTTTCANFDKFWKAYPRKTQKQTALKAFLKLKPSEELLAVILTAIEKQKQSEQWKRGVIPHPATWLNQERWDDEIPLPTKNYDIKSVIEKAEKLVDERIVEELKNEQRKR